MTTDHGEWQPAGGEDAIQHGMVYLTDTTDGATAPGLQTGELHGAENRCALGPLRNAPRA